MTGLASEPSNLSRFSWRWDPSSSLDRNFLDLAFRLVRNTTNSCTSCSGGSVGCVLVAGVPLAGGDGHYDISFGDDPKACVPLQTPSSTSSSSSSDPGHPSSSSSSSSSEAHQPTSMSDSTADKSHVPAVPADPDLQPPQLADLRIIAQAVNTSSEWHAEANAVAAAGGSVALPPLNRSRGDGDAVADGGGEEGAPSVTSSRPSASSSSSSCSSSSTLPGSELDSGGEGGGGGGSGSGSGIAGATCYVTQAPCLRCYRLLAAGDVRRVVCPTSEDAAPLWQGRGGGVVRKSKADRVAASLRRMEWVHLDLEGDEAGRAMRAKRDADAAQCLDRERVRAMREERKRHKAAQKRRGVDRTARLAATVAAAAAAAAATTATATGAIGAAALAAGLAEAEAEADTQRQPKEEEAKVWRGSGEERSKKKARKAAGMGECEWLLPS